MNTNAPHSPLSSPGLTERSSIPETLVTESRSRGVLDTPACAAYDDRVRSKRLVRRSSPSEGGSGEAIQTARSVYAFALLKLRRTLFRSHGLRMAAPRVARKGEGWWGRKDSNLRSHEAADLQSAPFATRDTSPLNSIATTAETADTRPWMTLKPEDPIYGPRSGAFMGEAPRQSQPTEAANIRRDGVKLPLFGTHDTSLP